MTFQMSRSHRLPATGINQSINLHRMRMLAVPEYPVRTIFAVTPHEALECIALNWLVPCTQTDKDTAATVSTPRRRRRRMRRNALLLAPLTPCASQNITMPQSGNLKTRKSDLMFRILALVDRQPRKLRHESPIQCGISAGFSCPEVRTHRH